MCGRYHQMTITQTKRMPKQRKVSSSHQTLNSLSDLRLHFTEIVQKNYDIFSKRNVKTVMAEQTAVQLLTWVIYWRIYWL